MYATNYLYLLLAITILYNSTSATLTVACLHILKSAKKANKSFLSYLKTGADPTSVQVFLEDCAAITGIAIASSCLVLSKYLAMPFLDYVGSVSIGLLLSAVASFLIKRNVASLVETSMSPDQQQEVVDILTRDPIVK